MGPGTGGGSRGWRRRRGDRGGVGGSSPGNSLASTKGRGEKYSSNARGAGSEREGDPAAAAAGRAADSIRAGSRQKNRDALGEGRGAALPQAAASRKKRKRPNGGVTRWPMGVW